MPAVTLETKFFRPSPRPGTVTRPRLDAPRGAQRSRLTLISAPAGFGKTTLLASWLAQDSAGRRLAWVALDEADRDADRFWTYVLTALDRAAPGTGAAALTLLTAGQPIEVVVTAVVNELSVLPEEVDLVLDDYHLADGPGIQPGMALLVDRLPPQVHLVISTRADPALPLARLRARGELTEIRAKDLRFTDEEAGVFLASATGIELDAADVARLGARTEGWIASLQLAALSLRDRDDPGAFISGFTGDDRYVVDYLVDEVLAHESLDVRRFLVSTSVLDRLTAPLCDAVTGGHDSQAVLESLERRNLFVVPLDDRRRWYRYHHLFGAVLRARLPAELPDEAAELHRRASRWHAEAGDSEAAVRHLLAAGDVEGAAELVELALPELRRERRESVIRGWVDELPPGIVADRPVLAAGFVGALMATNEFDKVPSRLQALEDLLAATARDMVVVDQPELARLPGAIATWRAGLALVHGDLAAAGAHAQRAVSIAAEGDDVTLAAGAALAGLASWAGGDVPAARADYSVAIDGLVRADHIVDALGCSLAVADMELTLGHLRDAERSLERALALAQEHSPASGVMRGTADMLVAMSRIAWHRDDLTYAAELLQRADALGESAGLPQHPYRWRVALARLRLADRDYATALELLDEAERVHVGDFSPPVHPIHATRARVLAASGDVAGGLAWAAEHRVAHDDEPSYLREYEHLTLARVLLAEHDATGSREAVEQASALLHRLLAAAEAGGRAGTVIEVEVDLALARRAAGDLDVALGALGRAVDLAGPEGWVRFFVDGGQPMVELLSELAARRPSSRFIRDLLTSAAPRDTTPHDAAAPPRTSHDAAALVDPLSDRELEVLRLLGSDLDGPGIARELVVSLNTVRTHTKHIYTKLAVNNRRAAISRAHQLGLLSRSSR
jgi:LuxR family maltose regulon positive regulatory protein